MSDEKRAGSGQLSARQYIPFKLLTYLLYLPDTDFLWSKGGAALRAKTGGLSRYLRVTYTQLFEALDWLTKNGVLESWNRVDYSETDPDALPGAYVKGVHVPGLIQVQLKQPRHWHGC